MANLLRRLLPAGAALALAAGSLVLAPSVSSAWQVPETLHAWVSIPDLPGLAASAPARLPFSATHLGLGWHAGLGNEPPQVRTSTDGSRWTAWHPAEISEDLTDPRTPERYSTLLAGGGARFVQVRSPGLKGVSVAAFNTRDGPLRSVPSPRSAGAAAASPPVITRAQWGADESLRSGTPTFARVTRLFVHHTATANDDPDPAATVRAIYAYHTQVRGWNDIGYNFLIDASGGVYEGRFARTYDIGESPTGEDLDGRGVVGAHVLDFNTGSAGVALLGDFTSVAPTPAAVSALVRLLAWKADRDGVDPLSSYGGIPNIAGHRDAGSTECPGDQLYAELPAIRTQVEQTIEGQSALSAPAMPTGTELYPAHISYDPTPSATGAVSRSVVRVVLTFQGSALLNTRTFYLSPQRSSFSLAASDYGGAPLPRDAYRVTAVAYDAFGRASPPALVDASFSMLGSDAPVGYWIAGADGGVFTYGAARFLGSAGGQPLNSPIVGMAGMLSSTGYWLAAADGGVFSFGDARFYGSTGGIRLNRPIVGMDAVPAADGYRLAASDGGVFSFGRADFYGSTGGMRLNRPIVGMVGTSTGAGYWLVASDGGVFSFGDARFFGSTGGIKLNLPIVGMAKTESGAGYWLLASDGGVFAFGDAGFYGSLPGVGATTRAVGIASGKASRGYYILGANGSVYAFGDSPYFGSPVESGTAIGALNLVVAH